MLKAGRVWSRWQASGLHLIASMALAISAAIVIFGIWYPQPYTAAAGADRLAMLLIGIDLVLGPLLTLIVYRHGKKGMAFDIAFIATVQLAALVYGLIVISQSRPVFVVLTQDTTFLTAAGAVNDTDLAEAPDPAHRQRSWLGPVLVAAPPPESAEDRDAVLSSGLAGKDINALTKYFRDYDTAAAELLSEAPPLSALAALEASKDAVAAFVDRTGVATDELRFLPLRGRNPESDWTIVFDRQSKIVGVVEVDPWPAMKKD